MPRAQWSCTENSAGALVVTSLSKLDHANTLELLIELMYEGQSGFIDELKGHEPIPLIRLFEVLRVRAGRNLGDSFDGWYQWYLGTDSGATAEEQDILENLFAFKQKTDAIVLRIKQQRGQPSD